MLWSYYYVAVVSFTVGIIIGAMIFRVGLNKKLREMFPDKRF